LISKVLETMKLGYFENSKKQIEKGADNVDKIEEAIKSLKLLIPDYKLKLGHRIDELEELDIETKEVIRELENINNEI
jgi:archaellum component FlaC